MCRSISWQWTGLRVQIKGRELAWYIRSAYVYVMYVYVMYTNIYMYGRMYILVNAVCLQRSPKYMIRSTIICPIVLLLYLLSVAVQSMQYHLETYTITQRIQLLHSSSLLCSCVVDCTQAHTLWKSWVPNTDPVARTGETKPIKSTCYSMCRIHKFCPEKVDLLTFTGEGRG